MQELQKKQRVRRIIYSLPLLIVLFIITFFLAKGAIGVMNKERESSRISKDLEEKAKIFSLREQELEEDIARIQTEEGIKDEIKERFSVIQEGEHVAVIVDERNSSSSTDDSTLPWYRKFWNVIMGNK